MSVDGKQLTDLEWEMMNHIWKQTGKATVRDVLEQLYPNGEKAYTTIQTVMNTLVEKKFLSKEKIGLVNFYQPTQPRDQVIKKEVSYFIDKVFRGSMPQFVKYFIGEGSLSDDEISELKQLIEQKEKGMKG